MDDSLDEGRGKKRPKIRALLGENIIFDGNGGARCPWCTYHQEFFQQGNFSRHILAKHPVEAVEKGFAACKRRRDLSEKIPESFANIVRSDNDGVHCQITNGQCRYMQPSFNVKRFQRHICLIHPWQAIERNLSIEENGGSYPKLHQTVLPFVTYDANGIYCKMDPNSKCSYQLPSMNTRFLKLHFMDHHPEHAEQYGFFEDSVADRPKTVPCVRTKPLSRLVEDNVYMDDEGCHCQLVPGCDYTLPGFCSTKLLIHFRRKHPTQAKANGFFEKKKSKLQTDFHVRLSGCTQKDQDGNYHCRIEGDCSFMQRRFFSANFLRHFRNRHRRAAIEKNLLEKPPQLPKRNRGMKRSVFISRNKKMSAKYIEKVRMHTEIDESGAHCRIAGLCEYVQSTFRASNFRRHFRNVHPREAKENGFFEGTAVTVVKSEFPLSARPPKRRFVKPNFDEMVEDCVLRYGRAIHCSISTEYCKFRQMKLDVLSFLRHFRKDHPNEARAKGFGVEGQWYKKLKMAEPVDPLVDIKQEVEADEEQEEYKELLTPDEPPPSMGPLISIRTLVEENILRVKTDAFCKISAEYCDYNRGEGFDAKDFVRHFRFKHPEEAREKGFFSEKDPATEELPLGQKSFRCLVTENVLVDEEGIHCMISETACPLFQVTFNVENFVRHFRNEHAPEAVERGFVRRKNFKAKWDDRNQPATEALNASEWEPANTATSKKGPRGTIRALVEECVLKDESGFHCNLTEFCMYVQTKEFRYPNFVRHFVSKHPVEAQAAGFDVDRQNMIYFAGRSSNSGKPSFTQLARRYTERDEIGIHCRLGTNKCRYVQRYSFCAGNFVRHFREAHSKEARKAGFFKNQDTENEASEADFESESEGDSVAQDVKIEAIDLEENEAENMCPDEPAENDDDPLVRKNAPWKDLVSEYIFRDEIGVHCRIAQKPCKYVQRGPFNYSNMLSHFRATHTQVARAAGFFRMPTTPTSELDLESVEPAGSQDSEVQDAPGEESQPEIPCPDTSHDELLEEKNPAGPSLSHKQLTEKFVFRDDTGVHCRISQWPPCKYVQTGTYAYQNFIRHFRIIHPTAARKAGFLDETSEPEMEQLGNETAEPGEGPVEDPIASLDEPQEENNSAGRSLTQRQLTEKYIFRDETGVHCRISKLPCKYVQTGTYVYQNFVRHFRTIHPSAALKAGLLEEIWEPETAESGEGPPVDQIASNDERWKSKNGLPILRRLTKNFVVQGPKGVQCRISYPVPCRYVQKGAYKYNNFVRHFRLKHAEEAREAGFFRDNNEAFDSDPEEDSETDTPIELDLGGMTGQIELVAKYVYSNTKGIYCRISSSPCEYVQTSGFKYGNFISHFTRQHTEEARKAGFFKKWDETLDPEPKPETAGNISNGLITQDETMESFTTEQSKPDNPDAKPKARKLRRKPPSLTKLAEKYIFRDENGIYCRIVPWKCKYVQRSTYVCGNFVRHFRTEHPKEARQAGFFRGLSDRTGPVSKNVAVKPTTVEKGQQQQEPCPERFQHSPRKAKKFNSSLTFTELAEKCIVRNEEGVHCRIVPWPPCRYVQKSAYSVGNFVRHFRHEHFAEARKIGFFKECFAPEPECTELEPPPLVPISQELTTESIVESDEPCPDTPHDDPAQYCRLCFAVDLPLAPIFSGPDAADNPLVESIEECINVRLSAEDDAWICSECSQKLVEFQEFRQLSRIHDSAVRRKKQLAATLSPPTTAPLVVVHGANTADTFYVEVVKQENEFETPTELPEIEGTSTTAAEPCEDQKPFIELPNGTFSCRLCPETFPSLGPTMEHFISAHSEAMQTNSVVSVDYSDRPPFKAITINNVQYLKCADCDTLTEHGEAIIEHRKRFHTGAEIFPKIKCDRAGCEQFFMDQPAYRRHWEICHSVDDPGEGRS